MSLSRFLGFLAREKRRNPPRVRLPYTSVLVAAWVSEGLSHITGRPPRIPLTAVKMAKHHMFFDCRKAESVLGFVKTSITDALREAVEWYEMNGYVVA